MPGVLYLSADGIICHKLSVMLDEINILDSHHIDNTRCVKTAVLSFR